MEEGANLSGFRTFVRFVLVLFYLFPLPLGVLEGLRFVFVALPGLFPYLFFVKDTGNVKPDYLPVDPIKQSTICPLVPVCRLLTVYKVLWCLVSSQ